MIGVKHIFEVQIHLKFIKKEEEIELSNYSKKKKISTMHCWEMVILAV
jgi:hypothetical protein